jgi:[acyl-carrier-protein] S-malonyltransferase
LRWLSAVAGIDLITHGTVSDADTIKDTAIAQPLLVAAGMVSLLEIFPHPSEAYQRIGAGAGHSVGEITLAGASGIMSAEQAMVFVRERGRAMAAAAASTATGMTAVLGGDADEVIAHLESMGITAANINGAGQIVAAGTIEQLDALDANPPAGARLRRLQVAGAFHTHHMDLATNGLRDYIRAISTHDARVPLISNADGQVVRNARDYLTRLVTQVSNPVRWDLCMETMRDMGVTAILELPPAGTLAGLAKRALPDVEIVTVKTPDDLDAAKDLIERHGNRAESAEEPTWRLVVAPAKGTFRRASDNTEFSAGDVIGAIVSLRDTIDIVTPHSGLVVEWLASDGDPVNPGQGILRLHPIGQG